MEKNTLKNFFTEENDNSGYMWKCIQSIQYKKKFQSST